MGSTYHRSFIILQQRDKEYSISNDKKVSGYCKIETKDNNGDFFLHVKNLKSKQGEKHQAFLISVTKEIKPQMIGVVNIDNEGTGELQININVADINRSGYPLDKFHALILVTSRESGGIGIPLVGYANKKIEVDFNSTLIKELKDYLNSEDKSSYKSDITKKASVEKEVSSSRNAKSSINDIKVDESSKVVDKEESKAENKEDNKTENKEESKEDNKAENKEENKKENKKEQKVESKAVKDVIDTKVTHHSNEKEFIDEHVDEDIENIYQQQGSNEKIKTASVDEVCKKEDELNFAQPKETTINKDTEHKKIEDKKFKNKKDEESIEGKQIEEDVDFEEYSDEDSVNDENEKYQHSDGGFNVYNASKTSSSDICYWDRVKGYFKQMFDTHKRINPFDVDLGNVEWIRIQEMENYMGQSSMSGFSLYGPDHYLVGLLYKKQSVKYIIYGLPGFCSAIPPAPVNGFSRWVPIKNGYGMGYWFMYLDANTGMIELCPD